MTNKFKRPFSPKPLLCTKSSGNHSLAVLADIVFLLLVQLQSKQAASDSYRECKLPCCFIWGMDVPVLPLLLSVILLEEDLFWSFVPVGMKTLHYEAAEDNLYKRYVTAYPADTNTYVPDLHSCGQDGLKCCLLCTVYHTSVILLEEGYSKGKETKISAIFFFTSCIIFICLLFILLLTDNEQCHSTQHFSNIFGP